MEFTQPSDPIVTNKTIAEEKRLTDIRNQVTLLEGETVRLRELIHAEKYEVNELVKQKAELESQLPLLNDKVSILKNVVENLKAEELGLIDYKRKVAGECEAAIKHAEIIMKNATADQNALEIEKAALVNEKAELIQREEVVHEQAMVLAEKSAKLRELIS